MNHCRILPHSPRSDIYLTEESLLRFHLDVAMDPLPGRNISAGKMGLASRRCICGIGHSTFNVDWNGDVYPCQMLRVDELRLGNLLRDPVEAIFDQVKQRRLRVPSYEIPKCSTCDWVLTCGGGCRAGAYYTHGSFAREDDTCSLRDKCMQLSCLFKKSGGLVRWCDDEGKAMIEAIVGRPIPALRAEPAPGAQLLDLTPEI